MTKPATQRPFTTDEKRLLEQMRDDQLDKLYTTGGLMTLFAIVFPLLPLGIGKRRIKTEDLGETLLSLYGPSSFIVSGVIVSVLFLVYFFALNNYRRHAKDLKANRATIHDVEVIETEYLSPGHESYNVPKGGYLVTFAPNSSDMDDHIIADKKYLHLVNEKQLTLEIAPYSMTVLNLRATSVS